MAYKSVPRLPDKNINAADVVQSLFKKFENPSLETLLEHVKSKPSFRVNQKKVEVGKKPKDDLPF